MKIPRFDKKIRPLTLIIACLVTAIAAALTTYFLILNSFGSKELFNSSQKYAELEQIISDNYIGETNKTDLYNAAATGMVKSLGDKWSYYMTAEEYEAYKLDTANEYSGIGISVKKNEDGQFEIIEINDGTPAANAKLRVGQIIISVDGEPVEGKDLEGVSTLIRSKLNKDFTMVVLDGGEELSYTLACEIIYSSPVKSRMLDNKIGYIKINNFEAGASENTIKAIESLISQGAQSFVFDVRNNPGGLLSELVSLLDYILPEGDILISVDKEGNETVSTSDKNSLKAKMVVLVNENTFSAAEFFGAALQEYDWATIVGQNTTGKGRSQVTIPLDDGGAIHISTHKYLTPNRVDLSEKGGIVPDISVTNEGAEKDAQLEAAKKAVS